MDSRAQLTALADEQVENKDYEMAIKILNTTIRLEPDNNQHYFERSRCHLKLGNYQSSLDDCNEAIRLNSNDADLHYYKGLALIGLSMFSDAIVSFKKAIELRAREEDSKLSDIFHLLKNAIGAVNKARQGKKPSPQSKSEIVHSTTDRPANQPGATLINHNKSTTSIEALMRVSETNGNNSLVAPGHQTFISGGVQMSDVNNSISNRVSSSASHMNRHSTSSNIPGVSNIYNLTDDNIRSISTADLMNHQTNQLSDQAKSAQAFEWNIRRSERIFLHSSSESGVPDLQYAIISRPNEPLPPGVTINPQRLRTNSNPSSIDSGNNRSATKRVHDQSESHAYQPSKPIRSRDEGAKPYAESEIDVVEDTSYNPNTIVAPTNIEDRTGCRKRLVVAPSSSMPATSQEPSTSATTKDDSYSTKYKRARRDRERARRGTSKLCTIKHSDLEELQRPSATGHKSHMRVIAPIDGWLYSGKLSIDDTCKTTPRYVVKLDGDSSGNTYLFNADTVLNDVIKEVRVKSVQDLRKGARICCYWSRQYKCLSTGVVTSRTFEPSKSLVSVKYDNGDLSALPLEDLRLLPPDYPKYMSNCDPLLLARNGESTHATIAISSDSANASQNSDNIEIGSLQNDANLNDASKEGSKTYSKMAEIDSYAVAQQSRSNDEESVTNGSNALLIDEQASTASNHMEQDDVGMRCDHNNDHDEATIPPTDETIDFITNGSARNDVHDTSLTQTNGTLSTNDEQTQRISIQDASALTDDSYREMSNSRVSSEENSAGIEYRPWVFDGPPRKSRRNGRTYRDNYSMIRRGNEVIRVGDSAELMPKNPSDPLYVAKIDGFWAARGEMKVRVRWYYRLEETKGEPSKLQDGDNALFETDHFDENDVQTIYRSTMILPWVEYRRLEHESGLENSINGPKLYYLAGHYDCLRKIKRLRLDVKEAQQVD